MESKISKSLIEVKCDCCENFFLRKKKHVTHDAKRGRTKMFCSMVCRNKDYETTIDCKCNFCDKPIKIIKSAYDSSESKKFYCSRSCAAKYNNTHKTKGTRRSKLEEWLENNLTQKFPNLDFVFNGKDAIKSELDIYIPSLKLAFELNGIFHYEPIFGKDKLDSIQNNDQRKFHACLEQGIELCIIDTSSLNYFKEDKAIKYLDIVIQIINKRKEQK